ncbi:complement C1q-like protein 4 [Megalobrama amblycephala]|uniref:complement C1q-like protein 4 n=1 Tax=Megalobrama amblycephala TaxID=75352 RepID=UPI002013D3F8|nr:complement C1q-like protein 4 [Megalobrama amblycephala]
MKALVCILLLLETFVFVVQQQVDGGLNENENPPQTDTLRAEASTDSQQYCHLCFPDIHAALRELTATVTEQKGNIRALETRLRDAEQAAEQQTFILEKLNKKNDDREVAFSASLMKSGGGFIGPFTTDFTLTYRNVITNVGNAYNPITGVFIAPLKGVYMFRISIYSHPSKSISSAASIMKNGKQVVTAYAHQPQGVVNSSNGAMLILEVGDVVYVKLWSGRRIHDNGNNHNTFSGYILFPLGG